MEYEVGPDGYGGGPSVLTLLPRFGGHVACRIWVDVDVSLFYCLFYFFYYLFNLFYYFTYFMLELIFMLEYI